MIETAGRNFGDQSRGHNSAAGCPLTQFPALLMVRRLLRMVPKSLNPTVKLGKKAGFPEKIMRDFKVRQA